MFFKYSSGSDGFGSRKFVLLQRHVNKITVGVGLVQSRSVKPVNKQATTLNNNRLFTRDEAISLMVVTRSSYRR